MGRGGRPWWCWTVGDLVAVAEHALHEAAGLIILCWKPVFEHACMVLGR
jgi:hypothetical protein